MTSQKTIKKSCSLSGVSLHHNKMVTLTFAPAGVDHGLTFEVNGQQVSVNPGSLFFSASKFTTLSNGQVSVECVEHVLSAVTGLGISNLQIILQGDTEPPWMDGSSWSFVRELLTAGYDDQQQPDFEIRIDRPLLVRHPDNDSYIKLYPSADLILDCVIEFDNILGIQRYVSRITPGTYLIDICRARSFLPYSVTGRERDTMIRLPGLRCADGNSNVIMYNDYNYLTALRYDNEPVRHKILDFLGDITVLGRRLSGHVVLHKPSHFLNSLLVKEICSNYGNSFQLKSPFAGAIIPIGIPGSSSYHARALDASDNRRDR